MIIYSKGHLHRYRKPFITELILSFLFISFFYNQPNTYLNILQFIDTIYCDGGGGGGKLGSVPADESVEAVLVVPPEVEV